jgi:hypothetical protein
VYVHSVFCFQSICPFKFLFSVYCFQSIWTEAGHSRKQKTSFQLLDRIEADIHCRHSVHLVCCFLSKQKIIEADIHCCFQSIWTTFGQKLGTSVSSFDNRKQHISWIASIVQKTTFQLHLDRKQHVSSIQSVQLMLSRNSCCPTHVGFISVGQKTVNCFKQRKQLHYWFCENRRQLTHIHYEAVNFWTIHIHTAGSLKTEDSFTLNTHTHNYSIGIVSHIHIATHRDSFTHTHSFKHFSSSASTSFLRLFFVPWWV